MAGHKQENTVTLRWGKLTKTQKIALVTIIALIVVGLAIGIPVGVHQHQEQVLEEQYEQRYAQMSDALDDCSKLETQIETQNEFADAKLKPSNGTLTITEPDYSDVDDDPEGSLYECVFSGLDIPERISRKIFNAGTKPQQMHYDGYGIAWQKISEAGLRITVISVS